MSTPMSTKGQQASKGRADDESPENDAGNDHPAGSKVTTTGAVTGQDDEVPKGNDGPPSQQQQQQQQPPQQRVQPPTKRLTGKTVFVTGLAPGLATIHLEKLFQKFGTIERLDIKMGKTSTASRYCFCEFDTVENAQKAMDNLNGRMLLHKRLVVQPAVDRDSSTAAHGHPSSLSMNPAREGKLLDKKIEELKRKINAYKK